MYIQQTEIDQTGNRIYDKECVIAFHCSGGSPRQWRALSTALGTERELRTPEHIGGTDGGQWSGDGDFTLADEAANSVEQIDQIDGKVHLVGHSYGGGVALSVALARPDRIASIALYEPCLFHLLPTLGSIASGAADEIQTLAATIQTHISQYEYQSAMMKFVDYWNGPDAWSSLKPEQQRQLIAWAPKAADEFRALLCDVTPLHAYQNLNVPVRLLQGECSPRPVKVVANALLGLLPDCQIDRLVDLGHMGPITHADYVACLLAAHIDSHDPCVNRRLSGSTKRESLQMAALLETAA